jgi:hypothetical protein
MNLNEQLKDANRLRKAYGGECAKLRVMICDKRARLRKSPDGKALRMLKADLKKAEAAEARAAANVYGIVDEIETGQTRLPLFDAARNGQPVPEAESAREPVLPRRGPGRPRKSEEARA